MVLLWHAPISSSKFSIIACWEANDVIAKNTEKQLIFNLPVAQFLMTIDRLRSSLVAAAVLLQWTYKAWEISQSMN